jgi:hypothetical protein
MILFNYLAEVRSADGISDSGIPLRDCILLNLHVAHGAYAQAICWQYWYSNFHVHVQCSACSCGE